jgi:hypothetical protein
MTWNFGDSFDLYAAVADAGNGYWDSSANWALVAGRFTGSRAVQFSNNNNTLVKTSGQNDAVHHFAFSFEQTGGALAGSTLGLFIELFDGATAQCSIVFRSDGTILLTSGAPNSGITLDTYTGAIGAISTWYGLEFEVVINNTTGSWAIRKNGNNVNDHSLGSLNTRGGTANNYANKITLNQNTAFSNHIVDDFFWQSGASSGNWLGEQRCYTRYANSDQSVTFSPIPNPYPVTPYVFSFSTVFTAGTAFYSAFGAAVDGNINSITLPLGAGYTGNLKCSIFADNGAITAPTTVLGSANVLVNPATGNNTVTFGTPVPVTKGVVYWVGIVSDTSSGSANFNNSAGGFKSATAYASFPTASPGSSGAVNHLLYTVNITASDNHSYVNEAQQDGLTTYVQDSNPGDADFYGISSPGAAIATTAVITRGYMTKSDAGTRTAAVQLKSGATTVATPTLTLTNSGFQWTSRLDIVDPNTSAAWTEAAVDALQIGPKVIA